MESFLATLGLLTTCLLQAAYWNAFREASSPYSRTAISTYPFSCSLLSSLLWAAYALPIVTPHRILFLLAHLIQSFSLSALLIALLASDSSSYRLRLLQVLQILPPVAGLSIVALVLGYYCSTSFPLLFGVPASAAAVLLLAPHPLLRMVRLFDSATSAPAAQLFVSFSLLASAFAWAGFGFAASDFFIAVPYVVVAALEALFLALSSILGTTSSAALQRRAAEGYELVPPQRQSQG
ncbi:hypothetical protein CLOM_g24088 [Closterium sp. NIES-68]|nr:hypothetical protein CLOM_g24088 [Closterium sp. NIES-68]